MAKSCKFAKKYRASGALSGTSYFSTCRSPKSQNLNVHFHEGHPIIGRDVDYSASERDRYNLCINGKAKDGTTPSKCKFY